MRVYQGKRYFKGSRAGDWIRIVKDANNKDNYILTKEIDKLSSQWLRPKYIPNPEATFTPAELESHKVTDPYLKKFLNKKPGWCKFCSRFQD